MFPVQKNQIWPFSTDLGLYIRRFFSTFDKYTCICLDLCKRDNSDPSTEPLLTWNGDWGGCGDFQAWAAWLCDSLCDSGWGGSRACGGSSRTPDHRGLPRPLQSRAQSPRYCFIFVLPSTYFRFWEREREREREREIYKIAYYIYMPFTDQSIINIWEMICKS